MDLDSGNRTATAPIIGSACLFATACYSLARSTGSLYRATDPARWSDAPRGQGGVLRQSLAVRNEQLLTGEDAAAALADDNLAKPCELNQKPFVRRRLAEQAILLLET